MYAYFTSKHLQLGVKLIGTIAGLFCEGTNPDTSTVYAASLSVWACLSKKSKQLIVYIIMCVYIHNIIIYVLCMCIYL